MLLLLLLLVQEWEPRGSGQRAADDRWLPRAPLTNTRASEGIALLDS